MRKADMTRIQDTRWITDSSYHGSVHAIDTRNYAETAKTCIHSRTRYLCVFDEVARPATHLNVLYLWVSLRQVRYLFTLLDIEMHNIYHVIAL